MMFKLHFQKTCSPRICQLNFILIALLFPPMRLAVAGGGPTDEEILAAATSIVRVSNDTRRLGPRVGRVSILADWEPVQFNGLPVVQVSGHLHVPLGIICSALNAQVRYHDYSKSATVTRHRRKFNVRVGSSHATVSNRTRMLNAPPWELRGHMMVPLKFIAEGLGANIDFLEDIGDVAVISVRIPYEYYSYVPPVAASTPKPLPTRRPPIVTPVKPRPNNPPQNPQARPNTEFPDPPEIKPTPEGPVSVQDVYKNSYALLIGINEYEFLPDTQDLNCAVNDVTELREVLTRFYGFPRRNIIVLTDEEATREAIRRALSRYTRRKEITSQDRVFIYFAGHGQGIKRPDGSEMGFFIPHDAQVNLNETDDASNFLNDCIPMKDVEDYLDASPAKHMLFMADACHSGLLLKPRGVDALNPNAFAAFKSIRSRQIITAVRSEEKARENPDPAKKHGIFTQALIEQLKALAAVPGKVYAATQIYSYLHSRVPQLTGGLQTPQMSNHKTEGDFLFITTRDQGGSNTPMHVVESSNLVVRGGSPTNKKVDAVLARIQMGPPAVITVNLQDEHMGNGSAQMQYTVADNVSVYRATSRAITKDIQASYGPPKPITAARLFPGEEVELTVDENNVVQQITSRVSVRIERVVTGHGKELSLYRRSKAIEFNSTWTFINERGRTANELNLKPDQLVAVFISPVNNYILAVSAYPPDLEQDSNSPVVEFKEQLLDRGSGSSNSKTPAKEEAPEKDILAEELSHTDIGANFSEESTTLRIQIAGKDNIASILETTHLSHAGHFQMAGRQKKATFYLAPDQSAIIQITGRNNILYLSPMVSGRVRCYITGPDNKILKILGQSGGE